MQSSSEPPSPPVLHPLQTSTQPTDSDHLPIPKEPTLFQSPSLSVAESFSTALSSPGEEREETSKLPVSSLALPQGLRKSISVDSFAQYSRDATRGYPAESSRQSRNNVYGIQPEGIVTTAEQLWSVRNRDQSLSPVHRDHDASSPPDSDVDRHHSHQDPSSTERFRRISLKTQESLKSFVRGGDLPLPSRTRNNSATAPSIVTSLKDRGSLPSVSSMSSLQSPSAIRGTAYDLNAGRMRSGSLGYNPPSKRPVINPHIPPYNRDANPAQTIVLAVIGTTGCGKSTVIRKGLSQYGLTEPTVISESSHPSRLPRYKRRTSALTVELPGSPTSPVAVPQLSYIDSIEVEIQTAASGALQWPHGLPPIDGVIICYDLTDKRSYGPVEKLLMVYRATNLPVMVLGCKSDLEPEVESNESLQMLKKYDTGLIEVSSASEEGREKMRQSFQYLLKAIVRQRGPTKSLDNRNPAAPPPLELKGTPTPWTDPETNSSSTAPPMPPATLESVASDIKHIPEPLDPSASPTDSKSPIWEQSKANLSIDSQIAATSQVVERLTTPVEIGIPTNVPHEILDLLPKQKRKIMMGPRPAQWVDLEALLDKLLFLAVSGEEPNFITNFLLTYRRFCAPRQVLLAMQKRMRQLDMPCGDPMFASFSQMRICHLLEVWIRNYPHDFSVKGTAGALHALMKSIVSKTHLMHYGSELLPFLEQLPDLKDQDASWAKKVDIAEVGSDESDGEEDEETPFDDTDSFSQAATPPSVSPKVSFPPRERKSSVPISRTTTLPSPSIHQIAHDQSPKQQIKELVKVANDVMNIDSTEIAQEITRTVAKRFLMIKPRDWLNYTFVSGNRNENEPITAFNIMSNHLADWVVSLILCHERPRHRSKQIEKFVEIAQKLRQMNNYSALRAFVAGINNAMDDPTMEYFNSKAPEASKNLKSWDVLLQQVRSHRTYRLALRNSKGACIPALEVHMTDLIRAHEGNVDTNSEYPTKVHWGKYNMMGRFITTTRHCQAQCDNSTEYEFPERRAITELFFKRPVMTLEMQKSRLKSQDFDYDEPIPYTPPRDVGVLRKIFFW